MESKHTLIGIASFISSMAILLFMFGLIVAAGLMATSSPEGLDEGTPASILLGFAIIGRMALDLVSLPLGMGMGMGMGMAGLCQKNSKMVFPILGTIFLIVLGNAM